MTPLVDIYAAAKAITLALNAARSSSAILVWSHCLPQLRHASVTNFEAWKLGKHSCMPQMLAPIGKQHACQLRRSAPHTEYVLDYVVERKRVDDLAGRSGPKSSLSSSHLPAVIAPLAPVKDLLPTQGMSKLLFLTFSSTA